MHKLSDAGSRYKLEDELRRKKREKVTFGDQRMWLYRTSGTKKNHLSLF